MQHDIYEKVPSLQVIAILSLFHKYQQFDLQSYVFRIYQVNKKSQVHNIADCIRDFEIIVDGQTQYPLQNLPDNICLLMFEVIANLDRLEKHVRMIHLQLLPRNPEAGVIDIRFHRIHLFNSVLATYLKLCQLTNYAPSFESRAVYLQLLIYIKDYESASRFMRHHHEEIKQLLFQNNFFALFCLAWNERLDSFERLLRQYADELRLSLPIVWTNNGSAACKIGQLIREDCVSSLQVLKKIIGGDTAWYARLDAKHSELYSLEAFTFFWSSCDQQTRVTIIQDAIEADDDHNYFAGSSLSVRRFILQQANQQQQIAILQQHHSTVLTLCCQEGDVELFKTTWGAMNEEQRQDQLRYRIHILARHASCHGHLSMLEVIAELLSGQ
ncbi:MAG: hypothetical protein KDH94_05410, partial [Coxiellaceae bacterium]|nr:hypothetical protein [Coxiellaceae bacterium]